MSGRAGSSRAGKDEAAAGTRPPSKQSPTEQPPGRGGGGRAEKTDPRLWQQVKTEVTRGDKGGRPGQWSARKAQLATAEYQREGGGYAGEKSPDNHLEQWTREDWGTKSGGESGRTGERYLPRAARASLTDAEYERTSRKKRTDSRDGRQFSRQPADVARKTADQRQTGATQPPVAHTAQSAPTRAALMAEARVRNIANRSRMSKAQLERALGAGR